MSMNQYARNVVLRSRFLHGKYNKVRCFGMQKDRLYSDWTVCYRKFLQGAG